MRSGTLALAFLVTDIDSASACRILLHIENDVLFSDKSYTQGARLDADNCFAADWWLHNFREQEDRRFDYGLSFGQSIYSPDETRFTGYSGPEISEFLKHDRPYAALIYFAFTVAYTEPMEWRVTGELYLGWTGPPAAGDQVQNGWHDLWHISNTRGWEHQIGFEPAR